MSLRGAWPQEVRRSAATRPCSRPRGGAARPWRPWAGSRGRERGAGRPASTKTEWHTAAIGERAPERTLAAVRASAPVAAMPPKNGTTMLPTPWAISSTSGSCLWPVMPSATTADSSDSMAPSIAMAKAEGARARMSSRLRPMGSPFAARQVPGQDGRGAAGGGCPASQAPAVFVGEAGVDGRETEVRGSSAPPRTRPRPPPTARSSGAGQRRLTRGQTTSSGEREERRRRGRAARAAGQGAGERGHALEVQLRHVDDGQAHEVPELQGAR